MRRRGIAMVIGIGACIAVMAGPTWAAPGMVKNPPSDTVNGLDAVKLSAAP